MTNVQGTIYLIHFDEPYRHARHYIGWTNSLSKRIKDHTKGNGSRLLAAVKAANISFKVVRTWKGDRFFERRLKNRKEAPKLCPLCSKHPKPALDNK